GPEPRYEDAALGSLVDPALAREYRGPQRGNRAHMTHVEVHLACASSLAFEEKPIERPGTGRVDVAFEREAEALLGPRALPLDRLHERGPPPAATARRSCVVIARGFNTSVTLESGPTIPPRTSSVG